MQSYGGGNLVPLAVPEISCLISLLNKKKRLLRTNSAHLTGSLVEMFEEVCYFDLFFNAKTPFSEWYAWI